MAKPETNGSADVILCKYCLQINGSVISILLQNVISMKTIIQSFNGATKINDIIRSGRR